MVEVSALARQNHLDLELSFARQFFLAHRSLDGLLRSDAHLLEVYFRVDILKLSI